MRVLGMKPFVRDHTHNVLRRQRLKDWNREHNVLSLLEFDVFLLQIKELMVINVIVKWVF